MCVCDFLACAGSSSAGERLEGDEVAKGKGKSRSRAGRQGQNRNGERFGVIQWLLK